MPYADLVRYCDSLLTPDTALEIFSGALNADSHRSPEGRELNRLAHSPKRRRVAV